ncbi:MAG: methyltransferase domain-containing protein [Deltaproteobacteria bacterium]|nr:methyltransferase domain-containing protein [Deltaproteobacteria bacterium]
MKDFMIDILICPVCLPLEKQLRCEIMEKEDNDVLQGQLICKQCGTRFPVEEGTAILLPDRNRKEKQSPSKYETVSVVSSYLWSHYADLWGDEDASTAYRDWADLFQNHSGYFLDAGCAVGRFTFEMSQKCDLAIGIDNSLMFIHTARNLMHHGRMDISIPEEGSLTVQKTITPHKPWQRDRTEFLVADVQAVPFPSGFFSSLSSLNIVDKVPLPLKHLREMNRVARVKGGRFLISDPFSWSTEVAEEKNWLGGMNHGPYAGRGLDNIASLLEGDKGDLPSRWKIEKKGDVWWKIRTHRNHFELIRSGYIKANR